MLRKKIPLETIYKVYKDEECVKKLKSAIEIYARRMEKMHKDQLYFVAIVHPETNMIHGFAINIPQSIDKIIVNQMRIVEKMLVEKEDARI